MPMATGIEPLSSEIGIALIIRTASQWGTDARISTKKFSTDMMIRSGNYNLLKEKGSLQETFFGCFSEIWKQNGVSDIKLHVNLYKNFAFSVFS